ncbi:MAG: hypothetical protein EXS49_02280 [Candidatus Pacebacteria bacterium]|nr:hypothetical protein [Candidatus Paceibacterota bacterium]
MKISKSFITLLIVVVVVLVVFMFTDLASNKEMLSSNTSNNELAQTSGTPSGGKPGSGGKPKVPVERQCIKTIDVTYDTSKPTKGMPKTTWTGKAESPDDAKKKAKDDLLAKLCGSFNNHTPNPSTGVTEPQCLNWKDTVTGRLNAFIECYYAGESPNDWGYKPGITCKNQTKIHIPFTDDSYSCTFTGTVVAQCVNFCGCVASREPLNPGLKGPPTSKTPNPTNPNSPTPKGPSTLGPNPPSVGGWPAGHDYDPSRN